MVIQQLFTGPIGLFAIQNALLIGDKKELMSLMGFTVGFFNAQAVHMELALHLLLELLSLAVLHFLMV